MSQKIYDPTRLYRFVCLLFESHLKPEQQQELAKKYDTANSTITHDLRFVEVVLVKLQKEAPDFYRSLMLAVQVSQMEKVGLEPLLMFGKRAVEEEPVTCSVQLDQLSEALTESEVTVEEPSDENE